MTDRCPTCGARHNERVLRLWLVERWDQVAKLAHKIHGAK